MSIFRIFQQGIVVGLSITCSAIVMAAPGEEGPESAMLDCVRSRESQSRSTTEASFVTRSHAASAAQLTPIAAQ